MRALGQKSAFLIAALLLDPSPDLAAFWKEARFDQLKLAELLRE